MSAFKPYERYKPSGVEWLGDVPEHWNIIGLHYLARLKSGNSITALDFQKEGDYPVYGGNGFRGYIDYYTHEGDYVLIGRQGALCGNINLASGKFFASEHAIVVNPTDEFNYKWLGLLLLTMNLNQYSVSAAQPGLSAETIGRLRLPVPPINEQTAIAQYLDQKTAQIDALIAKKQQLLNKLAEQRTALISHAVTKGLNPNIPLKASGVEWLGDVPEHWEVKQTRHVFSFSKGLTITKENLQDEGIPCVSYGEIHSKYGFEVVPEKHLLKCVDETYLKTDPNSLLNYGNFIFADTSEDIKGSGNFSYLNSNSKTFAGYHTIIARLKFDFNSRFLAYLFDSGEYRTQVQKTIKGVKVFSITQSLLKTTFVWLPPLSEQAAIAQYLDQKTAQIDQMTTQIKTAISKLTEYRSSLITQAVTGKIDVRNMM